MKIPTRSDSLELQLGEQWSVAATLPRKEAYALEHLTNQGFRAFFPRQRVTRRHARRFRVAIAPVFPGYLFVILDPASMPWRSINGTRGIRRLLTENERPLPVRAGVVETLVQSVDKDGMLCFDAGFKPGQAVRLLSGPFADHLGVVESLDTRGRVRLLFDLLGQANRMVVPGEQLQAV